MMTAAGSPPSNGPSKSAFASGSIARSASSSTARSSAATPRSNEALRDAIESTIAFLPIVTASSTRPATWARWEIAHFLNSACPVAGPPEERIFKATLYPVDVAAEPEQLRGHAEYRFYGRYGRDADQEPFPYPPGQLLQPGAPPAIEFGRLIEDLAARLSLADAPVAPVEGRRLIYVASSSLTAKRDRLCGDLRGKAHGVIAETPWPGATADEFRERVGMRLVECDSSIHLGAPSPPRVDGWAESVPDIELGKAMEVAARPDKSRFRIFSWEDNNAGAAIGFGRQVAERLSQTRVAVNFKGKGWEYMLSNVFLGLHDLAAPARGSAAARGAHRRLHLPGLRPVPRRRPRPRTGDPRQAPRPSDLGQFPAAALRILAPPAGAQERAPDDQSIVDRYQRFYKDCDGSVVLYGQSNELWALGRCDDINDFFGPQLARKAPAICVAPPEDDRKLSFQYLGFSRYRLSEIEKYVLRLPCAQQKRD